MASSWDPDSEPNSDSESDPVLEGTTPQTGDKERKMPLIELTYLSRQWQPPVEPPLYSLWMASSEVDQKFLGHFAKTTTTDNNYLSS